MKPALQILAIACAAAALSNCTTYVDPDGPTTTATQTTTTETTSPYYPGTSVTTRKTTTVYDD